MTLREKVYMDVRVIATNDRECTNMRTTKDLITEMIVERISTKWTLKEKGKFSNKTKVFMRWSFLMTAVLLYFYQGEM